MFCSKCGNKLDEDSKFCSHCGVSSIPTTKAEKSFEQENEPTIELVKSTTSVSQKQFVIAKKHIIKAAGWAGITGWCAVGFSAIGYIWTILDSSSTPFIVSSGSFIDSIAFGVVLIVLSRRIVKLNDIYIRNYVYANFILLLLMFALAISTGGKYGILLIVALIYSFTSLFNIQLLLRDKDFKKSLERQDYLLRGWRWLWYIILWLGLNGLALII